MSHNLEFRDGKYQMAYVGEAPWHKLGTKVESNLSAAEMAAVAGINWSTYEIPTFFEVDEKRVETNQKAIIRSDDHSFLSVVGKDWKDVQNTEAIEFFHEFVSKGDMEMHTAGSIDNGKLVWMLAKIKEEFKVTNKDVVEPYLLFTIPHKYGISTSVSLNAIRVVCENTLNFSLSSTGKDKIVRVNHSTKFDVEVVKETLKLATGKFSEFAESAKFLISRKITPEKVDEYLNTLYPNSSGEIGLSVTAKKVRDLMDQQLGASEGEGTWWQPLNAVTFYTDHFAGRNENNRLRSAWYGNGRVKKLQALNLALDMAT